MRSVYITTHKQNSISVLLPTVPLVLEPVVPLIMDSNVDFFILFLHGLSGIAVHALYIIVHFLFIFPGLVHNLMSCNIIKQNY